MKKWGKRILLGGAALLVVAVGVVVLLIFSRPTALPIPQPNGGDEVVRLARTLPKMPQGPKPTDDATASQIRAGIVSTPTFRSDVTNLLKTEFLARSSYSSNSNPRMVALFELTKRLLAEARDESNPVEDRMEICLIVYELGSRATRGGAIIDGMVSMAVRVNSMRNLSTCSSNATSAQLKSAAAKLDQLIKQAPTLEDYRDGEAFFSSTVPVKAKIESWIDDLKGDGITKIFDPLVDAFEPKMAEMNRIEQSTLRDLVVRSYTLAKGSPPTNWSDPIPVYLPTPLVDPVGKTNLSLMPGTVYKVSGW